MLSFAAVPLYRVFCRVTGYGGTTQVAQVLPETVSGRIINVRFNTDVAQDLPWQFLPPAVPVKVYVGEESLVFFSAENKGGEGIAGVAVYNVTPHSAAPYFNKIACFCFDNQWLAAGQKMDMPVSFFIDPEIENDPELKDLKTVTLSYTFFKSKTQNALTGDAPGTVKN